MSYILNTPYERISEEANGGALSTPPPNEQFFELGFDLLGDDLSLSSFPVDGICGYPDFAGKFLFDENETR